MGKMTVKIHGIDVELAKEYLGIRIWVQYYTHGPAPRFELFDYVGHGLAGQYHFFEGRRTKTVIYKHFNALNENGFKPFLLDLDKINEAVTPKIQTTEIKK